MAKRRTTKTKRAKRVSKTARAKAKAKRPTRATKKNHKAKKAVAKRTGKRTQVPKISETPSAPPITSPVPETWLDDPPESGTPASQT